MHRPIAALAATFLSAAAVAQIHACPGTATATYSDGDCPAAPPQSPQSPRTPRTAPAARADAGGGAAVDAPLEVVETGVPVITQLEGKFAWLDERTLAITTFADPRAKAPWMVRKVLAFDVGSRSVAPLLSRGFIDCVNVGAHLLGVEIGDLESRFAVASKSPPAVQQFELWDAATRTLSLAPADYRATWHPLACLKPAPADLAQHDLLGSPRPVRYLQPEHGLLAWGDLDADGHPEGPSLRTPKKTVALALSINDISHDVRWLPWRRAYQLAPGVHDRTRDPPRDTPLITMDLDGRLARQPIPAALARRLDAAGAPAHAEMIATAAGGLVVQPGAARDGGGFWLVQGERSRRVWCTGAADACTTTQPVAVSPDGCRIAFDARATGAVVNGFTDAPTVKVIDLCPAADKPGRGARAAR